MDKGKYSEELNVAVRVVHMACFLCQKVQKGLAFSISDDVVQSKDDDSPVTVAGSISCFINFSSLLVPLNFPSNSSLSFSISFCLK